MDLFCSLEEERSPGGQSLEVVRMLGEIKGGEQRILAAGWRRDEYFRVIQPHSDTNHPVPSTPYYRLGKYPGHSKHSLDLAGSETAITTSTLQVQDMCS